MFKNSEWKRKIIKAEGVTLFQISYPNGKSVYTVCQGDVGKIKNLFKCNKCDLCFATETRLKYHQATHTPLKQQQKQPVQRSQEQSNTEVTKKGKVEGTESVGVATYKCPSCKFSTNRRDVMIQHYTKSHWNKVDHKLEDVKETVRGDEEIDIEIVEEKIEMLSDFDIEEHFEPVKLTCSTCGFICENQDDFDFHSCEPEDQKMFICKLCTFECPTRMGLQSHVTRKHKPTNFDGLSVRTYNCEKCDYKCTNRRTMYSHRRKHRENEPSTPPKYFCSECDFRARTKGALYIHIQRRHKVGIENDKEKSSTEEKKPLIYKCDQCDYMNKNKYEMKVHVIRKHSNQYNYECEICGKKYKIRGDLTNHIRFQHREQPIICDVCGKTCGNSNSLYVHQKFAHYKAEFECHICHRRMVSQANLNEHILKQHEQKEDVVCEECGKTFTRSSRLKIHMRIHSGIKPFTCKVCGKAFSRKTALRQHLLIHTGKRPYQCDICGKSFTQKPGLISHRKSHPGSHPPLPRVTIDHVLSDLLNND